MNNNLNYYMGKCKFISLIRKAYNKLVIIASIGFYSFLIMRHGNKNKLGCYFYTEINTILIQVKIEL